MPSPIAPPSGCVFRTRCPHAVAVCRERVPEWEEAAAAADTMGPGASHFVACHRWRELAGKGD
jgi:peptide/nickel transport system ATP-binding protein